MSASTKSDWAMPVGYRPSKKFFSSTEVFPQFVTWSMNLGKISFFSIHRSYPQICYLVTKFGQNFFSFSGQKLSPNLLLGHQIFVSFPTEVIPKFVTRSMYPPPPPFPHNRRYAHSHIQEAQVNYLAQLQQIHTYPRHGSKESPQAGSENLSPSGLSRP